MNQQELEEYRKMFKKVHGEYVLVFPKDFLARHRYHIRFQPNGMSIVRDEFRNVEFLCYFNKIVHPSEFA